MSEMTAMPSLSSALMPASAAPSRPSSAADSSAGNAPNPSGPAAENPQAAARPADHTNSGPDAVVAQGADVSPFAAIMQRHLAQAAAKTDAVPVADLAAAPVKKAAEGPAPDPAANSLAALLPLIQSLAPNTLVQPGTVPEKMATGAAPAKKTAVVEGIVPDPAANGLAAALPLIQSLAPNTLVQPGTVPKKMATTAKQGAAPIADLVALPVIKDAAPAKKTAVVEGIVPDPAANGLAAVLSTGQFLVPSKAGQPKPDAASEKGQGAAPKAAQLIEGATPGLANVTNGAAATETLATKTAASDKAAITAALSAPTGDVTAGHTRQVAAESPEGSFGNLLAAAQASMQTQPSDTRAGASVPLHVEAPFGSSNWAGNVGDKLVWMVGHQEQRAELVLNPPHLGRVEVSLSLHGDQASAQFVSHNPMVRDALEAALPRLREMLAGAGVNLGQTQVGSGTAGGQSPNNQGNGDNSSRSSANPGQGSSALRPINAPTLWLRQGNGMVDVFA